MGTPQVGTPQVGTAQVGTAQVGTAQVGTPQVGTPQVGTAQVGGLVTIKKNLCFLLTNESCLDDGVCFQCFWLVDLFLLNSIPFKHSKQLC